jgi:glycosyltransferase involved in cell wall biosynthesis
MVGPFPPTVGGITSYMNSVINSQLNEQYKFIPFTISRPTIGIVKENYGYSIIKSIDFITLLKSIIITIYHLLIYPFVLFFNYPKLVHIHTTDYFQFWENYLHILVSKIFGIKIVLHFHATSFPQFYETSGKISRRLIKNAFSLADIIVLLSENQKGFFEKLVTKDKIHVLPNFVNTNLYKSKGDLNKKSNHQIKFVFIGGEESIRKGIYDVIKSISLVINEIENAHFIFIGRCNTDKVLEMIEKDNLTKYVDFKGYVSDEEKRKKLTDSDIFILPSYAEGLPIAILEAMSSGLAVISTNVGSIPETIKDGVNGYLISPGDYKALSEKLIFLSKNRELLRKIGSNNIELAKEKYDTDVIIHKIDTIYKKLINYTG